MNLNSSRYILLISIHGLIRSKNLELGRDADTGGQTKYVLELAEALSKNEKVQRVDLMTKLIIDQNVSEDYAQETEPISPKANIIRISAGNDEYITKESLWDWLDNFADNAIAYLTAQERLPDVIHGHYADAGYVGAKISHQLGIPLVYTGHSLGRSKRKRLLATGLTKNIIEEQYNIKRRINAEETTLSSAELVITSTTQEVDEQYAQYDYYKPEQMRVVPPGTDVAKFYPPDGQEWSSKIFKNLARFLNEPKKPTILSLSRLDQRKNIQILVEAFGQSKELQEKANLVVIAGMRDDATDLDESSQEIFTNLLFTIDLYDLYGKIAYPKKVDSEDVETVYRLAKLSQGVFVNPALTEPFGLTLIESAACGLPIVATKDGGPRDIISNCQNGYLIDPLDTKDITDRILQIIDNPQKWQTFSENGLTNLKKHYTWESHVNKYLEVIEPVIEKKPPLPQDLPVLEDIKYHKAMVVSSIDQNLLGDPESLQELISILDNNRKCISFCIATGRRLDSALKILRKYKIPDPEVLITSMGTEIYYAPDLTRDLAWTNHIDYQWNRPRIASLLRDITGVELQPKERQSKYKIGYFYDPKIAPPIDEIEKILLQNEQTANVIFSFGKFMDIIPVRASKSYALRWVANQAEIALENILVAGGSGADEDIMLGNTLSVVVANRHQEELSDLSKTEAIYFSDNKFAKGIIDGISHYNFLNICK